MDPQPAKSPRDYFDYILGIQRAPKRPPVQMMPPMVQPPQPQPKPIEPVKKGLGNG